MKKYIYEISYVQKCDKFGKNEKNIYINFTQIQVNITLFINSKLKFDVCKKSIGQKKSGNFFKSKFMKNMEKKNKKNVRFTQNIY